MSEGSTTGFNITKPAAADYSAAAGVGSQNKLCVLNTSGEAELAAAATAPMFPMLNRPASGRAATLAVSGVAYVQANGATDIAIGDPVTSNASGIAIKAASTNISAGLALEGHTADSTKLIPVLLVGPYTV